VRNMNLPVVHTAGSTDLIRRIEHLPVLSKEEEHAMAMRLRENGDVDAAQMLIMANLRNVVRIAMDYEGYGLPMEDIIQEGTIGLMIAVKKYDPRKGYRLMTYAVWWVKAMIHDYILKFFSQVKIGTTKLQKKLFYGLNRLAREEAVTDDPIERRSHAISARLDADPRQVEEIISRLSVRDQSLNSPVATDSDASFIDFLSDSRSNPEDRMLEKERGDYVKDQIEIALMKLTEREQDIARARLMAENPATLEDLGKKHKISKERVRQIENAVRLKLKILLEGHLEQMIA
jgi:RNA polymerase sigma-32 factor